MPTLISMTKDEAVVAEQVTTYKRIELEVELAELKKQNEYDAALLPIVTNQLEEVKDRISANTYKLELYTALIQAFDRDYPKVKIQGDTVVSKVVDYLKTTSEATTQTAATVTTTINPDDLVIPVSSEESQAETTPISFTATHSDNI